MERAGAGLPTLVRRAPRMAASCVVCGKGNNGGDGLVAARLLREPGARSTSCCSPPGDELRGDARANLERLPGARREPVRAPRRWPGPPRSSTRSSAPASPASPASRPAARSRRSTRRGAAARSSSPATSPSGVDASSGEIAGAGGPADATATFHAGKPGLWIAPGKTHAGDVTVVDIGIPDGAPVAPEIGLIDDDVLESAAARPRVDQVRGRRGARLRRLDWG